MRWPGHGRRPPDLAVQAQLVAEVGQRRMVDHAAEDAGIGGRRPRENLPGLRNFSRRATRARGTNSKEPGTGPGSVSQCACRLRPAPPAQAETGEAEAEKGEGAGLGDSG